MDNVTTYYDATAAAYDSMHGGDQNLEHIRALELSWPLIDRLSIESAVDVGCGTGRVLQWLHRAKPALSLIGIDPSKNMLDLAKRSVPHEASLQVARGDELPLPDNAVDLAVATGIMHHVDNPAAVITEMSRVARKALLISDHNNYAFGGSLEKRIRVALKLCGLFGVATFIKQGFNRQGYSAEDGWWYPYSLFDNYADVARFSTEIYIFPTRPPGAGGWANMLFIQGHFAILAIRRDHRPNPALT